MERQNDSTNYYKRGNISRLYSKIPPKNLEKEQQNKLKSSSRKEIISDINKTESRKSVKKTNEIKI